MTTFLVKTEPSEYSFQQLQRDRRCVWSGVSNAAALVHLRSMRVGDEVWIYHTGGEKAIVGFAKVTKDPYEDPARPGRNERGEPKFAVVDLVPMHACASPLTLATIKAVPAFADFALVTQPRLSVMPLGNHEAQLRSMLLASRPAPRR